MEHLWTSSQAITTSEYPKLLIRPHEGIDHYHLKACDVYYKLFQPEHVDGQMAVMLHDWERQPYIDLAVYSAVISI